MAIENVNTIDNLDKKLLETDNKWQWKTLVLANFDPRSSIVKSVFDCCLSGVD